MIVNVLRSLFSRQLQTLGLPRPDSFARKPSPAQEPVAVLRRDLQFESGTGVISGRVLTLDGRPAAGVPVILKVAPIPDDTTLFYSYQVRYTTTSSSGFYRLHGIPPGRYCVAAGRSDRPTYFPGVLEETKAAGFVIAEATIVPLADLALAIRMDLNVSGRVIWSTGRTPESNLKVSLVSQETRRLRWSTLIQQDGSFEFQNVRQGAYYLRCLGLPAPLSVVVEDQDVTGLELRLLAMVTVTTTVKVDGTAGPVPQLSLAFRNGELKRTFSIPSTVDLSEGEYSISLGEGGGPLRPGFSLKSIVCDSTDLLKTPLRITASDTVKSVAVTLQVASPSPWVRVKGRLIDHRENRPNTPGLEDKVALLGAAHSIQSPTVALQNNGAFEFPRVLPGTYAIRVMPMAPDDHDAAVLPSDPCWPTPNQLKVDNKDVSNLEITLPHMRMVTCRVAVEDGEPMPLSPCPMYDRSGGVLQTKPIYSTVPGGHDADCTVSLPEGNSFVVVKPQSRYAIKSVTQGGRNLLTNPIRVNADCEEMRIVLCLAKGTLSATVHGHVGGLESEPEAVKDVTLKLRDDSGHSISVNVDGQGAFRFPRVFQGGCGLSVMVPFLEEPGYFRAAPSDWEITRAIAVDKEVTSIEFALPHRKRVRGRIVVDGGHPVPGFRFIVTGSCPMTINVAAGADGEFRVNLPEGENWISVVNLPDGYALSSLTYGDVNLLDEPLRVAAQDSAELLVTFVAVAPLRTLRIQGRVAGLETRAFESSPYFSISGATMQQRRLGSNGEFEFPEALPHVLSVAELVAGSFSARCQLGLELRNPQNVAEVVDLRLVAVWGRMENAEGQKLPASIRMYASSSPSIRQWVRSDHLTVRPHDDGSFMLVLAPGVWKLSNVKRFLPIDTVVKAMFYGSVDVLDQLFTIAADTPPEELRIVTGARSV